MILVICVRSYYVSWLKDRGVKRKDISYYLGETSQPAFSNVAVNTLWFMLGVLFFMMRLRDYLIEVRFWSVIGMLAGLSLCAFAVLSTRRQVKDARKNRDKEIQLPIYLQ